MPQPCVQAAGREPGQGRYVAVSADLARARACDSETEAETAALEMGEGAWLVDTGAQRYQPATSRVADGEVLLHGDGFLDPARGVDGNLVVAAGRGNAPVVRALLGTGAAPDAADAEGGTALVRAVSAGDAPTVRVLLAAGARPDIQAPDGTTAHTVAARRGDDAVSDLLYRAVV